MTLAIIGGGVAGVAAAHTARAAGAEVSLFHGPAGASALYSGALDFELGAGDEQAASLTDELGALGAALGWQLGPCAIATAQGSTRSALARDRALLDLSTLAGKYVAVADLGRDDWDAALLVKSYGVSAWAKQSGIVFEARPVLGLKNGWERRIAPYDLAALHDQPERVEFLAAALAAAEPAADPPDAWLLGPWLGIERAVGAELSARLSMPVGEAASLPGGAAGARFELYRDRWLHDSGVRVQRVVVTRIERLAASGGYALHAGRERLGEFSAVVLAIGGMASGGIALSANQIKRAGAFQLSLEAPVSIELDGQVAEVSSLAAIDFVARGIGLLTRVGIAADAAGAARGAPGLFVAGDALPARPRGALSAAQSAQLAAHSALSYLG